MKKIEVNVGNTDRTVRIIVGLLLVLVALVYTNSLVLKMVLAILGVILIAVGITKKCPLYKVMNISATEKK